MPLFIWSFNFESTKKQHTTQHRLENNFSPLLALSRPLPGWPKFEHVYFSTRKRKRNGSIFFHCVYKKKCFTIMRIRIGKLESACHRWRSLATISQWRLRTRRRHAICSLKKERNVSQSKSIVIGLRAAAPFTTRLYVPSRVDCSKSNCAESAAIICTTQRLHRGARFLICDCTACEKW